MVRYMIWTRRAQPLGGLFGYLRVNLLGLRVVGYQRRKAKGGLRESGSEGQESGSESRGVLLSHEAYLVTRVFEKCQ
jgi:hypothetical protein